MSLNLDPGTFGGTKACHILVEKLNATADKQFAQKVISRFNRYFETMGELLKLDNPTRDIMMRLWFDENMRIAEEGLKLGFERHGINFTYFHNIMTHRLRQQQDHGALLEKFRGEDRDHNDILYALRMLAKARNLVDEN